MSYQEVEQKTDLFDCFWIIYKRRKMIMALVLIPLLLVFIYSVTKPFRYKATATFFPLNMKEYKLPNEEQMDLKPKLILEDLIISILKSREMADSIINELDLKSVWSVDTQRKLREVTSIYLSKSGVITLDIITYDPVLSAKIANAYIDNIENFNKKLELSTTTSIIQIIDRAIPPEKRMSRGLLKKIILIGTGSIFLSIYLAFMLEYIQKNEYVKRFKTLTKNNKS